MRRSISLTVSKIRFQNQVQLVSEVPDTNVVNRAKAEDLNWRVQYQVSEPEGGESLFPN